MVAHGYSFYTGASIDFILSGSWKATHAAGKTWRVGGLTTGSVHNRTGTVKLKLEAIRKKSEPRLSTLVRLLTAARTTDAVPREWPSGIFKKAAKQK